LPASEFPNVEEETESFALTLPQTKLGELLDSTSFAMAQQDVRYYLNGMLFEVSPDYLRVVATDGHRLAMETYEVSNDSTAVQQLILPRKGVMELSRLLADEGDINLVFGQIPRLQPRIAEEW
jgi:DNA polymerase-3 subunit beta